MDNILKKIIQTKKNRLIKYKNEFPINSILNNIKTSKNFIDFKSKIKLRADKNRISIIAEIKKASPSAGLLVKNFDPLKIAEIYINNNAVCLSVLTEEDFFLGKLDYIKNIKNVFSIPILCKDFFIDPYQVPLAKSYQADSILIILAAVDKLLAKDLYQAALDLNMSVIVEVHSQKEAELALSFEESIIGINNRNLKTLETSLDTTLQLSKILNSHKNPLICESGIHSPNEIKFVIEKTKIYNFLIGESLLTSDDIPSKLRELSQINL